MITNKIRVITYGFTQQQEVWLRATLTTEFVREFPQVELYVCYEGNMATITAHVTSPCFMQTVHGTILDTLVTVSSLAVQHGE